MANNTATSWIPGAHDLLGYGVSIFGNYFKPDLKDQFLDFTPYDLDQNKWSDQIIPGTTTPFKLPSSLRYSNLSHLHGETTAVESKAKMSEELSARANAKGTYGAFTGTIKASYKQFNETEEDRWYCITDGSIKVYSLAATNLTSASAFIKKEVQSNEIYTRLLELLNANKRCTAETEPIYFAFFDAYGTHVISEVELGGGLHIFTSVLKANFTSSQEVETSATAEYQGVFEGGGGADWKNKISKWLSSRRGSVDVYGGDSSSPLFGKLMGGLPTTDLSADLTRWAESVPKSPTVVDFDLRKIGDMFGTDNQRMLVNEAFEHYAQSYLSLSFANRQNVLEWRRQAVALPTSHTHPPNIPVPGSVPRFQGWCLINRTTGVVEPVIPFAQNTADQAVPAELKDPSKYNNDNYILLFSHWEAKAGAHWTETPFNNDVVTFLRRCGGGQVLQDYNDQGRTIPHDAYFQGYYVLCGVIGSGTGQGQEFTNIYKPIPVSDAMIIPLVPQRTPAGFRLNLLNVS